MPEPVNIQAVELRFRGVKTGHPSMHPKVVYL